MTSKKLRRRAQKLPTVPPLQSPDEPPAQPARADDELDVEFSLDDLGAAYAQALAEHDPDAYAEAVNEAAAKQLIAEHDAPVQSEQSIEESPTDDYVSPISIIEAALFVGHPENLPMSEMRLASLMRDVTPEEVVELIDTLNQSYRQHQQALRIIRDEQGYRMTIAPEVETLRRSFLGKVRDTRLNQAAIEVLALVAYQPGITAQTVEDQRGRESASLLSQLVRRQLLEIRRQSTPDNPKLVPHYYPTERFLYLFGLESLDDLPQVDEATQ